MNHRESQKSMARARSAQRTKGQPMKRRSAPGRDDLLATASAVTEQTRRLRAHSSTLSETLEALRDANQRFADLYDFVPIPYLIVSNRGIIHHVNDAALQLLGGEREWVIGRPLIAYLEAADMRKVLDSVLNSARAFSLALEVRIRAHDSVRVVQLITRRRYYDDGSPPAYHIAFVDLTEIRRLEAERRLADEERRKSQAAENLARAASEAKDEFLAMLSHELRTPLTPILAAADALLAHGSLAPDLVAQLDVIRRNVKAEARLIDDLLDVARITRNRLEVRAQAVDVHELLEDTLEGWRGPVSQHGLALDVVLDAGSAWVNGDAGRLGQVFRNVIANAVKFSEPGGRIEIRTETDADRLRVIVADHGAGMTAAQLDGLFTPFRRKKQTSPRSGLGLGLVISHAIVTAHEGTLDVSSGGPGSGTTVVIELPAIPAPAPNASASVDRSQDARAEPGALPTARVLLVEDDADSAEMLAMLLSHEGFQVQIAGSLHQARALAEGCDVLVSDIALPDGSGLDLMRTLRTLRPMRAIALSGYGSQQDVRKSLEAGFEEHLTKPVDLDKLVAAVRRLASQKA